MLISVMYHHVNSDRCSNTLERLNEHLKYIKEHFNTVFPGQRVEKNSICLTFDDAYADFFYHIFPLLKKYDLKALLAVPSAYILDDCHENAENRMSFEHNELFENYKKGTFCTFKELKQMLDSGLIVVASHSYSHINLLENGVNLEKELKLSKDILQERLNIEVNSFVFPFGKYNQKILKEAKKYYRYNFRIGNAIQRDFSGINGVIYRVDGDNLNSANEIFKLKKILNYKFKGFLKRLGNR